MLLQELGPCSHTRPGGVRYEALELQVRAIAERLGAQQRV